MLKSCKYCGKIHDSKYDCGKKPQQRKQKNDKDRFRSTAAWQRKVNEIRQRDSHLCQVCIRKLYDTITQYNYTDLEVHHGIPLEEDYDKRLDNDILLTICERHHEMAEKGRISRQEILEIIKDQEKRVQNDPPGLPM